MLDDSTRRNLRAERAEQDTQELLLNLDELIGICEDGKNSYALCAEGVKNHHLKNVFSRYAEQRGRFAEQLRELARRYGADDSRHEGTLRGAANRLWIGIEATISGGSEQAILDDCEHGEDVAVKAYQDRLEEMLPADVEQVLRAQYEQIKQTHDHIRALRDGAAAP